MSIGVKNIFCAFATCKKYYPRFKSLNIFLSRPESARSFQNIYGDFSKSREIDISIQAVGFFRLSVFFSCAAFKLVEIYVCTGSSFTSIIYTLSRSDFYIFIFESIRPRYKYIYIFCKYDWNPHMWLKVTVIFSP